MSIVMSILLSMSLSIAGYRRQRNIYSYSNITKYSNKHSNEYRNKYNYYIELSIELSIVII